jgi:hypothetical protein
MDPCDFALTSPQLLQDNSRIPRAGSLRTKKTVSDVPIQIAVSHFQLNGYAKSRFDTRLKFGHGMLNATP